MSDLMIILGTSGSGKTVLAQRLAADLKWPCLSKDDIKEALFDVLGVPDRAASRRLSDASFAALLRLARAQVDSRVPCLLDGNWRPSHAPAIQALVDRLHCRVAQIACRADPLEIARRFRARIRHPGHGDSRLREEDIARASGEPAAFLDVGGPRWDYEGDDPLAYARLREAIVLWRL